MVGWLVCQDNTKTTEHHHDAHRHILFLAVGDELLWVLRDSVEFVVTVMMR